MFTLRTIIIFGGMKGKLLQKIESQKNSKEHVNQTTAI